MVDINPEKIKKPFGNTNTKQDKNNDKDPENKELIPQEIVKHLDRNIIGQYEAKRAVAIALRNRWRRMQVTGPIKEEITPKNILMVGPTGCGKTEIARRIAKLSSSPFLKVEATKFTEVGYVGRDVDSIIRDLMEIAINLVQELNRKKVKKKASVTATNRLLDALVGKSASEETRKNFENKLKEGILEEKEIDLEILDNGRNLSSMPSIDIPGGNMGILNIGDLIGKAIGGNRYKKRRMKVSEAYKILLQEESDKLIDEEDLIAQASKLTENSGIVFIDEIDKVTANGDQKGREVSREGVQRDLLPLLEGTIVTTKYGPIKTEHILFIASGAFHMSKPSDLLPELQGRLPTRVMLKAIDLEDMIKILKNTDSSLLKQYKALMAVEGIDLSFTDSGIKEISSIAIDINKNVENIGARRLHTIMEKLLEDISFNATGLKNKKIVVNTEYVNKQISDVVKASDISKFIL